MSPILTRPVREQLEHDRVIRQLQARYKRKHDVVINPGSEQNQSVTVGQLAVFPDLLLYSPERGRRLQGTVEVETGESVNQLEALAEWGVFSKLNVPLHLYVPPTSLDTARRLCAEHQIALGELWTFHVLMDQVRFTMIHRSHESSMPKPKVSSAASRTKRPAKAAGAKATARSSRPARKVGAKGAASKRKPAAKRKPAPKKRPKGAPRRR
ncbi:MAG: hypothetical protein ACRD2N_20475 [Vicinamibacterales bacterium]